MAQNNSENQTTKEVQLIRIDFYSGQSYSSDVVFDCYFSSLNKKIEERGVYETSNSLQVQFASSDRPWDKWSEEIKKIAELINGYLSRNDVEVILSGKSPLSMFLYLGLLVNRSLLIANEFNGKWSIFDTNSPHNNNKQENYLQLEHFHFNNNNNNNDNSNNDSKVVKIGNKKFAVLFVTLNSLYKLSEENINEITQKIAERKEIELNNNNNINNNNNNNVNYYRLSPVDQNAKPLSLPSVTENSTVIGDYREEIRKAYENILTDNYQNIDGMIVIGTGPQPISYMLGMLYKANLFGELLLGKSWKFLSTLLIILLIFNIYLF